MDETDVKLAQDLSMQPTLDSPSPDPHGRAARATEELEQIGPYRIIERIGEGGMGLDYKAEQREPAKERLRRAVARVDSELLKPGISPLKSPENWMICQILMHEANSLIEPETKP